MIIIIYDVKLCVEMSTDDLTMLNVALKLRKIDSYYNLGWLQIFEENVPVRPWFSCFSLWLNLINISI